MGGAEASAVTCTSRQLGTPTVGAIAVKREVELWWQHYMYGVDVVRAFPSSVQPVLGRLQGCIRHRPILNFIKKIIKLTRYSCVDLWIVVIERRADNEVRCSLYLLRRRWSGSVGRPGSRTGRWRWIFNLRCCLKWIKWVYIAALTYNFSVFTLLKPIFKVLRSQEVRIPLRSAQHRNRDLSSNFRK